MAMISTLGRSLPWLALLAQLVPVASSVTPIVSCSENTVQLLSNPSFEDGSAEDWTIATTVTSIEVVEAGTSADQISTAADGQWYLQTKGETHAFDLSQTITGFEVGSVYTASFSTIVPVQEPLGACWIYAYLDSKTSANQIYSQYFGFSSASSIWQQFEFTFESTSNTNELIYSINCGSLQISQPWYIGWDNFEVSRSVNVCTTSFSTALTPTPTPSSSAVVSAPSSSAIISSSSSAIISAASSSSSVLSASSSVKIPASSSPTVISVTSSSTISSSASSSVSPASSSVAVRPSSRRPTRPCTRRPHSSRSTPGMPTSLLSVTVQSSGNSGSISTIASATITSSSASGNTNSESGTTSIPASSQGSGEPGPGGFTTSTIFSTHTATITACPTTITNCPANQRTSYITTETIVVSTTVCPVTAAQPTSTSGASPSTVSSSGSVSGSSSSSSSSPGSGSGSGSGTGTGSSSGASSKSPSMAISATSSTGIAASTSTVKSGSSSTASATTPIYTGAAASQSPLFSGSVAFVAVALAIVPILI